MSQQNETNDVQFPTMIDMETIGTEADATIVQIGLVAFDPNEVGRFHSKKSIFVDINQGRRVDPNTIKWWMKTDPALFAKLVLAENAVRLEEALVLVSQFYNNAGSKEVWANSPSFDVAILNSAYKKHGMRTPFFFRGERCYRTLMAITGTELNEVKERCYKLGHINTVHNALDDAIHQAIGVQMAYEKLRRV